MTSRSVGSKRARNPDSGSGRCSGFVVAVVVVVVVLVWS